MLQEEEMLVRGDGLGKDFQRFVLLATGQVRAPASLSGSRVHYHSNFVRTGVHGNRGGQKDSGQCQALNAYGGNLMGLSSQSA